MTAPRVTVRKYFLPKRVLPFADLQDKTVEFKFCGRPKHRDLYGKGRFDIIPSGKPDYLRIEIIVRPPDGTRTRIPISRTMLACIKTAPPEMHADYCLFFQYQSRKAK
jgi:hypothetical protein